MDRDDDAQKILQGPLCILLFRVFCVIAPGVPLVSSRACPRVLYYTRLSWMEHVVASKKTWGLTWPRRGNRFATDVGFPCHGLKVPNTPLWVFIRISMPQNSK
jgi:hypothetical protein